MASLSAVFTETERTNWLKAWLAVDIAKSGLEQFAENEAKTVHTNIYNNVWSIQDTDFNGIISFMMNCKHFDNKFSFPISTGKHSPPCLLTMAREIGRTVRHSSQCKVTDPDLQDVFTTLTNLLSDQTSLAHDVNALEAVKKLAELQKDTLKITTEEMIHLLDAANDTLKKVQNIADKSLDEMQIVMKQEYIDKQIDIIDIIEQG
ncbi:hypothetical protein DPMN_139698 [Dreissena polymorpha]|uniref:Uncharacterized protein n=1 Tax=Dreissena polymorpha TaxID=45954 RepID=A0A9D4G928_DREPO|nr:hypothetical protein DPMN_139698 [Dreissena polymorpha]